jgi:hypothetical protein
MLEFLSDEPQEKNNEKKKTNNAVYKQLLKKRVRGNGSRKKSLRFYVCT